MKKKFLIFSCYLENYPENIALYFQAINDHRLALSHGADSRKCCAILENRTDQLIHALADGIVS